MTPTQLFQPRAETGGPTALSIVHVVATVDDPGAGPSASVPALARAQRDLEASVRLHTVAGWKGKKPSAVISDLDVRRYPSTSGLLGHMAAYSPGLREVLFDEALKVDVIHTHGLWLAPNIHPAAAVKRANARAKLVMSPRGMLGRDALNFSAWRKRVVWQLVQRRAAETAHCLHATAHSELEEMRAAGLRQPVAIIPNGIEVPPHRSLPTRTSAQRTVLSLGRVHPKKGLDRLLSAWAEIEGRYPQWRLRIIGPPEDGYDQSLRQLQAALSLSNVSIEGAAFGEQKRAAYEEADLFVLPTLNENFAMTVAEALSQSVPVISTTGAPWAGLKTEGCGWWIEHGQAPMVQALSSALSLSDGERQLMGAKGREWMLRDFAWRSVGSEMLAVYRWLAGHGDRPSTVAID